MYQEHMRIMNELPVSAGIHSMVELIRGIKMDGGRLFFIGNGGGAGHASHAAADFRKIAEVESYAWGDNVSDLTAYCNDVEWAYSVVSWLNDSRFGTLDGLFVFSVGGTNEYTSRNLLEAIRYAHNKGSFIMGITGLPGEVAMYADCQIVLNTGNTPVVEGIQSVLWHMIVNEV